MDDKKGREAELMELQKAEESHRDLLLKDRDERNNIAKDLHLLRRCSSCSTDKIYEALGSGNAFIWRKKASMTKLFHGTAYSFTSCSR